MPDRPGFFAPALEGRPRVRRGVHLEPAQAPAVGASARLAAPERVIFPIFSGLPGFLTPWYCRMAAEVEPGG